MLDKLDVSIIKMFTEDPRIGVLEASRRLNVARGTVRSRLARLQETDVIRDFGPSINPEAIGFPVTAFVTAEIAQSDRDPSLISHLAAIPEVLEAQTITGPGDLLIRIVARSNSDLQRVVDQIVNADAVLRTSTVIVLASQVAYRTAPLIQTTISE
ncbi:Lrp/AsnC family transcriptional regulator [Microbacterium sp.]|uniref:Lrp/AsnC family transcriptional regulator n=1 Tax=Microbacterium sp. TaxID=51671 RepID=UPI003C775410